MGGGQVRSDDGERSDDGLALNHDSAVPAGNHHFNGSGGVIGQRQHGGIIRVVEERELHGETPARCLWEGKGVLEVGGQYRDRRAVSKEKFGW